MEMEASLDLKFAALADPTRRAILSRLAAGEATVAELHLPFAISQPAISKHLKVLERAGLIDAGRSAQSRPRRLRPDALRETAEWAERIRRQWRDSFDRLDEFLDQNPEPEGPTMTATTADAQTKPEFVISRTFDAPRARVWRAWTEPDQMLRWLGPKGTTGEVLSAEVRPGGLLHWKMTGADGAVMWGRAIYRDIVPMDRLTYVQSFSDPSGGIGRAPFFGGRWPLEMLTTVTLADDGAATKVTLTWSPIDEEPDERNNFIANIPSMQGGWGGSFDQLVALLSKPA